MARTNKRREIPVNMDVKNLIPLKRAAERTGYSEAHLRRLCGQQKVFHVRIGARYYFFPEDVARLFVRIEGAGR